MPKNIDIFVESLIPIKAFVKDIENVLGIKVTVISDADEMYYEYRTPQIVLTVGIHDLINDRDLNFEDYRYHVSVRAINIGTEENRKKWRDAFAELVVQRLKATKKYKLMLVDNLQVKREVFQPKLAVVPESHSEVAMRENPPIEASVNND